MEAWKRNVVQIVSSDETIRGAGFLLCGETRFIVTCAHVVRLALGTNPPEGSTTGPAVRFLSGDAARHPTTIRRFDATKDVCVLELSSRPREGGEGFALELGERLEARKATAIGFPQGGREVVDPDVTVISEIATEIGTVWQLRSENITPGFSGGPLIDVATWRVLGIVKETMKEDENGKLRNVAYAIPIWTLVDVAEWASLVVNWERGLVAPSRLAEVLPVIPIVYPALHALTQSPVRPTAADEALLHATQDYLAAVLPIARYAALYAQPRNPFDVGDLAKNLQSGNVALFLGSRFFADLGLTFSSTSVAAELSARFPGEEGTEPRLPKASRASRTTGSSRKGEIASGKLSSTSSNERNPNSNQFKTSSGRRSGGLVRSSS